MFERFTTSAREVVRRSMEEARGLEHGYIGTEHLLLGLLDPRAGTAHDVLAAAGATPEGVRADIRRLMGTSPAPVLGDEDAEALRTIGIDLDAVLARIEERFGVDPLAPPVAPPRRGLPRLPARWSRSTRAPRTRSHLPLTKRAKKVLELALREAVAVGSPVIGTEHLLLGLIREGNGLAARVLTEQGIALEDLRRATLQALDRAA